jgi:hypothetical protein
MRKITIVLSTMIFMALFATASAAQMHTPQDEPDVVASHTPPRLSMLEGQVSFWRPGAEEWVEAQINTPLAPGDQLYSGAASRVEFQVGAGAFMRGGSGTQIGFEDQGADYLHFSVTEGQASLDVRTVDPGYVIVVDTPAAAFTLHSAGYYRIEANAEHTTFITRKGGQASAVLANGETLPVTPDQAVTIAGKERPKVTAVPAPAPDGWDTWNYARTDRHLNAESARYVSTGTYGLSDLDKHGTWRTVPTYGRVWVPAGVAPDWVPYSTGSWMRDPYYGWTWVDTAPWGWAPYHYGRWVYVNNVWVWAPGPIVPRPVYAPALVAFYGQPGVSVSVGIGGPVVGWVSLGWGEPLVPWWGGPGFIHRPWWGGWAGPRVVNNVIITHTTVVHVRNISTYRNAHVRNSVVMVNRDRFGRGPVTHVRLTGTDPRRLQPLHTAPHVSTRPSHFVPSTTRGIQPPREHMQRTLVSGRPQQPSNPAVGRGRAITTDGSQSSGRRIERRTTTPSVERQAPSSRQSGRNPAVVAPDRGTDNRQRPSRLNQREGAASRRESPAVGTPGTQQRAPERPESRSSSDRSVQTPPRPGRSDAAPPAVGPGPERRSNRQQTDRGTVAPHSPPNDRVTQQRPRNEGLDAGQPPVINRSAPTGSRRSTEPGSVAPRVVTPPSGRSSAPATQGNEGFRGYGRNPTTSPPGGSVRSTPQQPQPSMPSPTRMVPRQSPSGTGGSREMSAPGAGVRSPSGRGAVQHGGGGR